MYAKISTKALLKLVVSFITVLLLEYKSDALAQSSVSPIINSLIEHGFVNVSASVVGSTITLGYENRRFRSQSRGLAEVFRLAIPYVSSYDSLNIVVLHFGKPVLQIHSPTHPLIEYQNRNESAEVWLSQTTWSIHTKPKMGSNTNAIRQRVPTLRSMDISVGVGTRYVVGNFGTLDENYRVALDLEPEVRVDLPLGLLGVARWSVPLHNNLDDNTHVRPSLITVNKPIYFKGPTVASVQAGIFTFNRIGVHSTFKRYLADGVFFIVFEGGYTHFTDINGRIQVPDIEEQSYSIFLAKAAWRYRPLDLELEASYGQFLYQDNGFRIDVRRSVGDHRLGLFAMDTEVGRNLGFQIALAIPPRRYAKPIPFRVRPTEFFNLDYRFAAGDRSGRIYDTADYFIEYLYQYDPQHMKRELLRYF